MRNLGLMALMWQGCLSFDQAGEQWDAWVAAHSTCEIADDCVVVYTDCPLGCWTAVAAAHAAEAAQVSDDLVNRVEAGGASCAYDCLQAGEPTCDAGQCTVGALQEF